MPKISSHQLPYILSNYTMGYYPRVYEDNRQSAITGWTGNPDTIYVEGQGLYSNTLAPRFGARFRGSTGSYNVWRCGRDDGIKYAAVGNWRPWIVHGRLPSNTSEWQVSSIPYHYDIDNKVLDSTLFANSIGLKVAHASANAPSTGAVYMFSLQTDSNYMVQTFSPPGVNAFGWSGAFYPQVPTAVNYLSANSQNLMRSNMQLDYFEDVESGLAASKTLLTTSQLITSGLPVAAHPVAFTWIIDTDALGRLWLYSPGAGQSPNAVMSANSTIPAGAANVGSRGYFTPIFSYIANTLTLSQTTSTFANNQAAAYRQSVSSVIMTKIYNATDDLILINQDLDQIANTTVAPSVAVVRMTRGATPAVSTLASLTLTNIAKVISYPTNLVQRGSSNTWATFAMYVANTATDPTIVRYEIDKNLVTATIANCTITFNSNTFAGAFAAVNNCPSERYLATVNAFLDTTTLTVSNNDLHIFSQTAPRSVQSSGYGAVYHQGWITTSGVNTYITFVQFDMSAARVWANSDLRRSIITFQTNNAVGANNLLLTYHSSFIATEHLGGVYNIDENRTAMVFTYRDRLQVMTWNDTTGWQNTTTWPADLKAFTKDSRGRIWAHDANNSTWMFDNTSAAVVEVTVPDVTFSGSQVNANLQVDARFANGARANTLVKLELSGGAAVFSDNSTITTTTTSNSASVNVAIIVTRAGTISVTASSYV